MRCFERPLKGRRFIKSGFDDGIGVDFTSEFFGFSIFLFDLLILFILLNLFFKLLFH